nr:hypothetical protein CFP56_02857 [Quercus suber]
MAEDLNTFWAPHGLLEGFHDLGLDLYPTDGVVFAIYPRESATCTPSNGNPGPHELGFTEVNVRGWRPPDRSEVAPAWSSD